MFNSYRLLPAHGFDPVQGAELRKRASVFQRSPQGRAAPAASRAAPPRGNPDGPPFTR